ncbi:MAG: hypothetical protein Q4E33_03215 [Erysipelotrichaceae bacterium]|nr:hypothetical protein [Erysipelotrichaceae bacterium]
MAKTKEELKALKQECESFTTKAQELSEDELNYVTGGSGACVAYIYGIQYLLFDQLLAAKVPAVEIEYKKD